MQVPLLRELALAVFEETLVNTRSPFAAGDIAVPVAVAFDDRDWILPRGSRRRNALPAHTRWVEKPAGVMSRCESIPSASRDSFWKARMQNPAQPR